jgi:hypothetical protein
VLEVGQSGPDLTKQNHMKRILTTTFIGLSAVLLISGCVIAIGSNESKSNSQTVGQQLTDLQHAKEAGAITDAEFQAQKAKILNKK